MLTALTAEPIPLTVLTGGRNLGDRQPAAKLQPRNNSLSLIEPTYLMDNGLKLLGSRRRWANAARRRWPAGAQAGPGGRPERRSPCQSASATDAGAHHGLPHRLGAPRER